MPFDDIIILQANQTGGNRCPTYHEYFNDSTDPTHSQKENIDFIPLFDQKWFGITAGCNCTGVTNPKVRAPNDVYKDDCSFTEKAEKCTDVLPKPLKEI